MQHILSSVATSGDLTALSDIEKFPERTDSDANRNKNSSSNIHFQLMPTCIGHFLIVNLLLFLSLYYYLSCMCVKKEQINQRIKKE